MLFLQHFKSSQNVFFLDKFRAYRAIFTVIENHSFFNAKFNFKYPLIKVAKKNQQVDLMKRMFQALRSKFICLC
jgi:hypothetical protein